MADDPIAWVREILRQAETGEQEPASIAPRLLEAVGQIAAALDKLAEAERNLVVQQAVLDQRLLRVERNRAFMAFNRVVEAGSRILDGIRRRLPIRYQQEDHGSQAYAQWVAHEMAAMPSLQQARAASHSWNRQPRISVIAVERHTENLRELLVSLQAQAYDNWEICAAVNEEARNPPGLPEGVHLIAADGLDGVGALNAGASVATGEYLCLLQGSGSLAPLALYSLVEVLQECQWDVIYSDEDSLDAARNRVRPVFKPDWSPDLLTSCVYVGNLVVVRRDLFFQVGGLSGTYAGAYLVDLILRLAERPLHVRHIPRVLYHRLPPSTDAAGIPEARQAIADALLRREQAASSCELSPDSRSFITRRKQAAGEFTAVICSKSPDLLASCLESLRGTASHVVRQIVVVAHEENGPNPALWSVIQNMGAKGLTFRGVFHFADMCNLGAGFAESPNLLFLNDDIRATAPDWAELLAEQVSREEVGVAGAILRYPDGALQHAGIVVGVGDGVGHIGRHMRSSRLWPWLLATRNVSAVTGACLAIRKNLFGSLGGFDTLFPNNYNDVDLCFRARARGYRVLCVAVPGLIHHECQSRLGVVRFEERFRFYERWAARLRDPDPYYSPSLAPMEEIALNLEDDRWYRPLFEGEP